MIQFVLGLFVGAPIGLLTMALIAIGGRAEAFENGYRLGKGEGLAYELAEWNGGHRA